MNCRQRTHGRQVMQSCKPLSFRLSETRLTCSPSCRHAGKRLHGCAAGCVNCSKINMLEIVQVPEQLLCHPTIRLTGRLCSSANIFMQTYVQHLLSEVHILLHTCTYLWQTRPQLQMVYSREWPFTLSQVYAALVYATIVLF